MCTFGINRQSAPAAVIPTLLDTGGDCCGLVTGQTGISVAGEQISWDYF